MSIRDAIETARAEGRAPLAILDIDLTLLDNATRTRAIFADWAASERGAWSGAEAAVAMAPTMPIVFSVHRNLATLGVTEDQPELAKRGLGTWLRGFFGERYPMLDTPLPGAVEAVLALRAMGATVAYLTARTSNMAGVTTSRMRELGFPVAVPGTLLVMKPDATERDGAYKRRSLEWLGALGSPVLCADNEPGHANAMHAAFPNAVTALITTRHSPGAPALDPGVVRTARLDTLLG